MYGFPQNQTVFLRLAIFLAVSSPAVAQSLPPLAPHRAVYDLSVVDSRESTGIQGGGGRLVYEFAREECHGFKLNYRQAMKLESAEGAGNVIDFRSSTYEDDDAHNFRFETLSTVNSTPDSQVTGSAERKSDRKVSVHLTKPGEKTTDLPKDTLYPTEHLRHVLEAAHAGKNMLEAQVFDGSSPGDTVSPTLAVIGAQRTDKESLEPVVKAAQLDKHPRWPITISYFEPVSTGGEQTPKFIFNAEMFDNGVARALRLDYGNFVVEGKLVALEYLPSGNCRGR